MAAYTKGLTFIISAQIAPESTLNEYKQFAGEVKSRGAIQNFNFEE